MEVKHESITNGDLKIELYFDKYDVLSLKHNLCGIKGIVDWYSAGPSREKIGNCKERLLKDGLQVIRKDPDLKTLPIDENEMIDIICSHKFYRDDEKKIREYLQECQVALEKIKSDLLSTSLEEAMRKKLEVSKMQLEASIVECKRRLGE